MSVIENLLTEKLRPKSIDNIILLDRIKKSIKNGEKIGQHLLFSGHPGTGKTTLAKILAKDYSTLFINISSERGIDVVREEIVEFCSTMPLGIEEKNDFKVIILDELEGATPEFFKAMRATMEKFADNVRFIATSNLINKIPEPIQSRFLILEFDPKTKEEENELFKRYKERVLKITKALKLEWENEETLNQFIKKDFPDLRKLIQKVQDFNDSDIKIIKSENINRINYSFKNIYNLIVGKSDPHNNYKIIIGEYKGKENEIILSLNTELPDWLKENYSNKLNKLPQMMISIADWDYKKNFMIDPVLGLLAMIYQLQIIWNN